MRKKLLLIDDSKMMRERTLAVIEDFKDRLTILEAADAFEAERVILQSNPDILLLDISMPGKNGLELLKDLNDLNFSSIVIVFSNFASDQYKLRAKELGADFFVCKHESFEELPHILEGILGGNIRSRASGL